MGQITTDTWLGSFLKDVCNQHPQIKTVVEIGTWDGMGSTDCIIQGLSTSDKSDIKFISLETNSAMYEVATNQWKDKLPAWASLVHGKIVEESDMDSTDLTNDEKTWFVDDLRALTTCPNVLDCIPKQIDLLLLDGGEFSTYSEFEKLKDRSSLIVLDDTNIRKCKGIRNHVIAYPEKYRIIFDFPNVRNGIMGVETI